MFEHQDAVRGGDGDRPARSTLADNGRDQGHAKLQTLLSRAGNGLRLATFFRLDAGKGSGRVYESDDRQSKAIGKLHQADRLAIAFRPCHPEIMLEATGRVVALFVADKHDLASTKPAQSTDDRL